MQGNCRPLIPKGYAKSGVAECFLSRNSLGDSVRMAHECVCTIVFLVPTTNVESVHEWSSLQHFRR